MLAQLPLLFHLSAASAYAALVLGLVRFRKADKGGKALAILCVMNGIELTITLTMSLMKIPNLQVENVYRPIEIVLIAAAYWNSVEVPFVRRWVPRLAALFIFIWLADSAIPAPFVINANMAAIQRLIATVMSVITLHQAFRLPGPPTIARPVFWVGTSVLVYTSGTFFVLGFSNELISLGIDKFIVYWQINWALLLVANLLYMKGMLCKPQHQT